MRSYFVFEADFSCLSTLYDILQPEFGKRNAINAKQKQLSIVCINNSVHKYSVLELLQTKQPIMAGTLLN